MRFLVTKEKEMRPLLRFLISGVLAALALYLLLDILSHALFLGIYPDMVYDTLYGNEERFIEPMPLGTLLLQVHIDWFMTLFAVLILSAITVRVMEHKRDKRIIVHMLGIGGLLTPMLLLGAYFVHTVVLSLWMGLFIGWHLFAFVLSLILIGRTLR